MRGWIREMREKLLILEMHMIITEPCHAERGLFRVIPFEILRKGLEKISDTPHTFYFFRGGPPHT